MRSPTALWMCAPLPRRGPHDGAVQMTGRVIGVVGPSGVGKDTVMAALAAAEPRLALLRRVITRPEALGGEPFEGVSEAEFAARRAAGAFVLDWQAHGLCYGIPRGWPAGRDVLVNLSRAVLGQAGAAFGPGFMVLELTAAPEVLAARLAARGREDAASIAARLARQVTVPEGLAVLRLDNSGALDATVAAARAALYPDSGRRAI